MKIFTCIVVITMNNGVLGKNIYSRETSLWETYDKREVGLSKPREGKGVKEGKADWDRAGKGLWKAVEKAVRSSAELENHLRGQNYSRGSREADLYHKQHPES